MSIYEALSLAIAPGKEEPDVWVSRLVIYEKLLPEPVQVREIPLTRGLNIVWAEEPDDDNAAAEITGHSAGKTSFCRLLRYVLGEKTFGTKANTKLIQAALPHGRIAAEIHIGGKRWAVMRSFDKNRRSYIKADATIEELLNDRGRALGQDEYVQRLGLADYAISLETASIVRTNQPIEWGHVLAWCTRDQEARFQNVYDWRSGRSESEWPSFKGSKTDALFVMRALLGLFLPDELKGEEELAALLKRQEELEAKIPELKREPHFRVNLHTSALRSLLAEVYPSRMDISGMPLNSGDLMPDLTRLATSTITSLDAELSRIAADAAQVQEQLDDLAGEARQLDEDKRRLDAAFGLTASAAAEIDATIGGRATLRRNLQGVAHLKCDFGDVLFSECEHIRKRQDTLKITQLQDAHAMEQAEARRAAELQRLDDQKGEIDRRLADIASASSDLRKERQQLQDRAAASRQRLAGLRQAHGDLVTWTRRQDTPGEFPDLDQAQAQLRETQQKIEQLNTSLGQLLAQHDASRDQIAMIFTGCVRAVLPSGTYEGAVGFADRELQFQIVHGSTMSGEAVETLSVLLADVACLVYSTATADAKLPGLLLHDSPREADLGLRLYRSFIRLIADMQAHFGAPERCPFQYILTTTTPPPEELRDGFVKLPLDASKRAGLLFCRSLHEPVPPPPEGDPDDETLPLWEDTEP